MVTRLKSKDRFGAFCLVIQRAQIVFCHHFVATATKSDPHPEKHQLNQLEKCIQKRKRNHLWNWTIKKRNWVGQKRQNF